MVAATDIATNCTRDPVGTRERLRGVLRGGKIVLEPQADGTYMARFNLLPLAFTQNSSAVPKWLRDGGVYGESCGGPLREPYTDLEIPVEVSLVA